MSSNFKYISRDQHLELKRNKTQVPCIGHYNPNPKVIEIGATLTTDIGKGLPINSEAAKKRKLKANNATHVCSHLMKVLEPTIAKSKGRKLKKLNSPRKSVN